MVERESGTHHPIVVGLHSGSELPYSAFFPLSWLHRVKEATGADFIEFVPTGLGCGRLPIGPTFEIKRLPLKQLKQAVNGLYLRGHVEFNPYARPWNIFVAKDPLRPESRMAFYNVLIADRPTAHRVLKKLEQAVDHFPINVYPPHNGKDPYFYRHRFLQTTPYPFNDHRGPEEHILACRSGYYDGITVDLYHMGESTRNGTRPYGTTEDEHKEGIEKIHKTGFLAEIHIQPGRLVHIDQTLVRDDELSAIFRQDYNTRLGHMLQFLIYDLGFKGPLTSEVDPRSFVPLFGRKVLGPSRLLEAHRAVLDYVKNTPRARSWT